MKRFASLLAEARFVVTAALALIGTTSAILVAPSEPHVRCSGELLLVLGLLFVLFQLKSVSSEFSHPPLLTGFRSWLKRLRFAIKPPASVFTNVIATGSAAGKASAIGIVPRANPDLATLLADLRREFEDRKKFDDERYKTLIEKIDKDGAAYQAKILALESAHGKLGDQVEALAVGDLYTAFIGVILTLIGTIETGLAPEITRFSTDGHEVIHAMISWVLFCRCRNLT